MSFEVTGLRTRAMAHAALSDPARLAIVESLWFSDRTPTELRSIIGADWNLLGYHLDTLERAGVTQRTRSEGDGRRRYVRLRTDLPIPLRPPAPPLGTTRPRALFVCTHNAARSQFAAALWRTSTGLPAASAGSDPAPEVHPLAVRVASEHGVDLARAKPRGYSKVRSADLIVSVCDRARERPLPHAPTSVHWSVPDPMGGTRADFEKAFADITARMFRLAVLAPKRSREDRRNRE